MNKLILELIAILMLGFALNLSVYAASETSPKAGPDWDTFIRNLERKIRSNWNVKENGIHQMVVVIMTITKDGKLLSSKVKQSSNDMVFDNSCLNAISKSEPFEHLPIEFVKEKVNIEFSCTSKSKANPEQVLQYIKKTQKQN